MDGVALLTIFVLSIFVGFEVVSKVSTIRYSSLVPIRMPWRLIVESLRP